MAAFQQHRTTKCNQHYQIAYSLMGGFPVIDMVKKPKSMWTGTGSDPKEINYSEQWDVKSVLYKVPLKDNFYTNESMLYLLQLEMRPDDSITALRRNIDYERPKNYLLVRAERSDKSFEFNVIAEWSQIKWIADSKIVGEGHLADALSDFVQKHRRSRNGFEYFDWWEDGLFDLKKIPCFDRTYAIGNGDVMCWRNYEGESCDSVVKIKDEKGNRVFVFVKSIRMGTEWNHKVEEIDYDYEKLASAHHLLPVGRRD